MSYKHWIFVAVGLFGFGLALGLAVPGEIAGLFAGNIDALKELGAALVPFEFSTALFILRNNVMVLLFSFIFSPILCLVPILALTVNGGLISFISAIVVQEESLGFLLAGLAPHGIFELPAIIIGEAAALSFGAMVVSLLLRQESRNVLVSVVKRDWGHMLLALILFFVAGIFHAIIILALLEEPTRNILVANLKQNLKYLMIAFILLVPAAVIETFVTPWLLG